MTDNAAFNRIAHEHGAMIRRIAMSHEAKPHLAEELMQDIYLAIWRALPAFRADASMRTFVARIATNRSVSHVVRSMKTGDSIEVDEGLPSPGDDPERQAISEDRSARLQATVRALPLAYRQVAMLTLDGLTNAEIADVLGISANAVAVRLSRARDLLRSVMGDQK